MRAASGSWTRFQTQNPNSLDLDLEDGDNVINATAVSTIIDNLLLPNEQFYEICSQLNEGQHHMFNFIMQFALHCKLAEFTSCHPSHFKYFQVEALALDKAFNQGNN